MITKILKIDITDTDILDIDNHKQQDKETCTSLDLINKLYIENKKIYEKLLQKSEEEVKHLKALLQK